MNLQSEGRRSSNSRVNVHVPILGTRGVGKTSFIISLMYLISQRNWGEITGGHRYYAELLPSVMDPKLYPLAPTSRSPVGITLNIDCFEDRFTRVPCNFTISTGDISGQQFEDVMSGRSISSTMIEVLWNVDAIVILLDITRYLHESNDNVSESVMRAFADQIHTIGNAIFEMLEEKNSPLRSMFFVFNKMDLHKRTVDEIAPIAENAWAPVLRRLRMKNVFVYWRTCCSVGWAVTAAESRDRRLGGVGVDRILVDIIQSFNNDRRTKSALPGVGESGNIGGQDRPQQVAYSPLPGRSIFPFMRGKYYRRLYETIQLEKPKWVAQNGPMVPESDIWSALKSIYPMNDLHPGDVVASIRKVDHSFTNEADTGEGRVRIRGRMIQLTPHSLSEDEWRVIEEVRRLEGSCSIEQLSVLWNENWNRERLEAALKPLELAGVLVYSDGRWYFRLNSK
ncbi:MAG TPA: hypothetical protein VFF30_14555 [Nitrososphaerales archaeon]|nr:hypothetical protein [Nitrososphaerales archaeon]